MEKQNQATRGLRPTKDRVCIDCDINYNGYRTRCRECYNKKQRDEWHDVDNPKKKYQLSKRYHTTPEKYVAAMASSNCCEICNSLSELCYDHDHNTMKFRGVLCRSCNKAIGQLGDTVEGVRDALVYLVKHYSPKDYKIISKFTQQYNKD
jgi:hypothetical protein